MKDLKYKKLIRSQRKPAFKAKEKGQFSTPTQDIYQIDIPGVETVENGFSPLASEKKSAEQYVINIFGNVTNIEQSVYQYIEEMNINNSQKTELKTVFQQLQEEAKKEQIQKSKVKELLKTIIDKGSSKLLDAAIGAIVKEILY
ncbi:hypothetical protein [Cohnella sp. GbtcB17]|uniref:hypothetical protein n=1 Tax=Cohnella sp. GbtcB17 TaxID=2824762 RepID=UPI001C2F58CD|nr:hypothetical protein [Cohnella sp. GbtcB17]